MKSRYGTVKRSVAASTETGSGSIPERTIRAGDSSEGKPSEGVSDMKKIHGSAIALASVLVLSACAPGQGANTYSRNQARTEQSVRMGTVEGVRTVRLEGTRTPIGTLAGGVVGGVAGSTVGGGRGSTIAAVVGAVAGGLAGSAIEEGVTRKDGLEITVRLDNGNMIAITQEADEQFKPGERVRILSGGGVSRVTR
jgi:outer membrane lipoprotein SlyB